MIASASPVIAGALVFLCLVVIVAVGAGLLAWRAVRRRWRALRSHAAVRGAEAFWGTVGARRSGAQRFGARGRPPIAVGSMPTAGLRSEMWQAVDAADRAVRDADVAGASIADLPSLCRRLRSAATDVDRLLAMGDGLDPAGPEAGVVRRQASEILSASAGVRLAAVAAASDAAEPRVRALVADADREVQCVAAGLLGSQAAVPHHRP